MAAIPKVTRCIMVNTLGSKFREVTEIQEQPVPLLEAKTVLVKVKYVGINASDINFTAGRYFGDAKPPFRCGFEANGEVIAVGADSKTKVGQCVLFTGNDCFSEYCCVPETQLNVVPSCDPAFLAIFVSGPTASVAFEKEADLKAGQTVLVTGAAGGTGQFAVQLAKQAGCHVIGTCSSPAKVEFLKSIGCDRPINYKVENLDDVLQREYPKGLNCVYECIGGTVFDAALNNLAKFGRILIIGQISTYEHRGTEALTKPESKFPIAMNMLVKSASLRGFFLVDYLTDIPPHTEMLEKLYAEGMLKIKVDKGENHCKGLFKGLESVADAIDYMYTGQNTGKLVVEI